MKRLNPYIVTLKQQNLTLWRWIWSSWICGLSIFLLKSSYCVLALPKISWACHCLEHWILKLPHACCYPKYWISHNIFGLWPPWTLDILGYLGHAIAEDDFKPKYMLKHQLKRSGDDDHVLFMCCCIYSVSYSILLAIDDSFLHVLLGMASDIENCFKERWNQVDSICP